MIGPMSNWHIFVEALKIPQPAKCCAQIRPTIVVSAITGPLAILQGQGLLGLGNLYLNLRNKTVLDCHTEEVILSLTVGSTARNITLQAIQWPTFLASVDAHPTKDQLSHKLQIKLLVCVY